MHLKTNVNVMPDTLAPYVLRCLTSKLDCRPAPPPAGPVGLQALRWRATKARFKINPLQKTTEEKNRKPPSMYQLVPLGGTDLCRIETHLIYRLTHTGATQSLTTGATLNQKLRAAFL